MEKVKVTDGREFGYYRIDNVMLIKYAKDIGVYALAVYNVLALHADNKSRKSWPSTYAISKMLGISRTTVVVSIATLERAKLIIQTGKRGRVAEYRLTKIQETRPLDEPLMVKNKKTKLSTSRPFGDINGTSDVPLVVQQVNTNYTQELDLITTEGVLYEKLLSYLKTQPNIRFPEKFLDSLISRYGKKHLTKLLRLEFTLWKEHLEYWCKSESY